MRPKGGEQPKSAVPSQQKSRQDPLSGPTMEDCGSDDDRTWFVYFDKQEKYDVDLVGEEIRRLAKEHKLRVCVPPQVSSKVGDILIGYRTSTEPAPDNEFGAHIFSVVEVKQIRDLEHCLTSGKQRFDSQTKTLRREDVEVSTRALLVIGGLASLDAPLRKAFITSGLRWTLGSTTPLIPFHLSSLEELAYWIIQHIRVGLEEKRTFDRTTTLERLNVTAKRTKAVTPDDHLFQMLTNIRGVTEEKARSLCQRFGSIERMAEALRADQGCLGAAKRPRAKGKKDGSPTAKPAGQPTIGPAVIKSILTAFGFQ